jgi:hypothetical protein
LRCDPTSPRKRGEVKKLKSLLLNPPPIPGDQCQAPTAAYGRAPGTSLMESIRPDNTDPIPLRPAPNQFGTIMLRFVGLLAVAIAVLAFVYSR